MEDLRSVSRSVLEGPHSLPRNSMEDADYSATRKRPRLDSGESILHKMSTDEPAVAQIPFIDRHQPSRNAMITSAAGLGTDTDRQLLQSPSKVTINVRDRGLDSTSPSRSLAVAGTLSPHDSHQASTSSAPVMPPTPPPVPSASRTPSRSPEIEVAELEEFDDDPRNTRWKPLHETNAIEVLRELLATFPGVGQYRNALVAISRVNSNLERGAPDLGIVNELGSWIDTFLGRTAALGSIWWDLVTEYRQFWDSMALTMPNLLKHSIRTREEYNQFVPAEAGSGSRSDIQIFFCAYIALATRMIGIDCQTLSQTAGEPSATPDLVSIMYVDQLQWIGHSMGDSPLCRSLQAFDDTEPTRTIATIISSFSLAPIGGLEYLGRYVELLFDRFHNERNLPASVLHAMRVVHALCSFVSTLPKLQQDGLEKFLTVLTPITCESLKFYRALDAKLDSMVGKQAIALSQEVTKAFMRELGLVLRLVMEITKDLRTAFLPDDFDPQAPMSKDEQIDLIAFAWEYGRFDEWIRQGRMELRVQGVEMLQNILLAVYQKYIRNRSLGTTHDIAQYFASRLIRDELVAYLVGVESHPQLICQSGNIIGFLIVTERFSHADSDIIWKSVASTQDLHTVDAILEMTQGTFNIAGYPVLLQFCESLGKLPVRAFDARMLRYFTTLLEYLRSKFRPDRSHPRLDLAPYHLCVKLLRHATAEPTLSQGRRREICHLAHSEMQALMSLGLTEEDSDTILRECVEEISSKSSLATGAIAAINALIQRDPSHCVKALLSSFNIVSLAIGEFSSFLESCVDATMLELYDDALAHRLTLLEHIILQIPHALNAETAAILWNSLMSPTLPSEEARDLIWHRLGKILSYCMVENTFMNCCIEKYMLSTDPMCLTSGVVPFMQQVLYYHARMRGLADADTSNTHDTAAKELLWHVVLSVPRRDLAKETIKMLVTLYSDCNPTQQTAGIRTETASLALVERCIVQLIKAADSLRKLSDETSSGEEESMVFIASENEIQTQRYRFLRSLDVLKELTKRIRSQAQPTPSPELGSEELRPINGRKIRIHYQAFSGGVDKRQRSLEIGDLESFEVLMSRLSQLTGFSKFTAIAGGQRLDADLSRSLTLREMKLDQKGQLLLRKAPDAEAFAGMPTSHGLRPLESEIVKHFDRLYNLLGMDEELGKEVFDYLATYPPSEKVLKDISCEVSVSELFPPDVPYKSLYAINVLKSCLARHFKDGEARRKCILHGLRILLDALEVIGSSRSVRASLIPAQGLVDCLLAFLKEPVVQDISDQIFANCSTLVDRIHNLISTAQSETKEIGSDALMCDSFGVMLECSLHSTEFWESFSSHQKTRNLLESLTLESESIDLRKAAVASIRSVCGMLPAPSKVTRESFISFFWKFFLDTVEKTLCLSQQAEQFYEIALEIFRLRGNNGNETLPATDYISSWSAMLINQDHEEFIGRENVDWAKFGLAGLIDWGIRLLKAKKEPFSLSHDLVRSLFSKYLFPQLPSRTPKAIAAANHPPILHSATRARLYSILLALSNDLESYHTLSTLVMDLLSPGEESQAWSWGCAQLIKDCSFEPNWNFEPLKAVRSPTGYPGLRNLSNTCYLNSLFTQLFMNVAFREFILGLALDDSESSQRQMFETKKLFAYMQESWLKSVDPHVIAELGIQDGDTPIDVSIQMDVDEFYNLLFSKWESQIASKETARSFNKFYGGQIVQQIHAKPCDHISERLEQFSAIQLEIQGKATLAESLAAYIVGEAMEGDNQYACERCGDKRDALKRACLKDIPDSLIFHLKRFSYDIATGMRNKVNDRFEFPNVIDMTPYTSQHLMHPETPSEPDIYALVGVLVHSGTAESGHYYSYIRERPVNSAQGSPWLEFNDADVSRFDPVNIPDQCFGGWNEHNLPNMRYLKSWNAYMLFYERVRCVQQEPRKCDPSRIDRPVKATIPTALQSIVTLDNDVWIRKYCMFDQEHGSFIKSFLSQLRVINKGFCTDSHDLEKQAIQISLEHANQIFSRSKGGENFDGILKLLGDLGRRCPDCCHLILATIAAHEAILRNLLLRNPDAQARARFSNFILEAVKSLRLTNRILYGLEDLLFDPVSSLDRSTDINGAFQAIIHRLWVMRVFIQQNNRSWDDYFGLLQALANIGNSECQCMLDVGFLRYCLELLIVDQPTAKNLRLENPHLHTYYRLMEKGRKFSLRYAMAFLDRLMDIVDLTLQPYGKAESRPLGDAGCPLSIYEEELLRLVSDATKDNSLVVLEKVIPQAENPVISHSFLRKLLCAEPEFGAYGEIQRTILTGINLEPAFLTEPYLNAVVTFCEFGPQPSDAKTMVRRVAREVDSIGLYGGAEHLAFFARVRRTRNVRVNVSPSFFHRIVLELVPVWAPTLLMYADSQVRKDTIHLLHAMVFNHDVQAMDDEQRAEEIAKTGKSLCDACLRRFQEQVITPGKTIDVKTVEEGVEVIRHCTRTYFDLEIPAESNFISRAEGILDELLALTVTTPEDEYSGADYDSDALSVFSCNST